MIDTGVKGALISPSGTYRYKLWRCWDSTKGQVCFIGLNPSTADGETDDATIRRCVVFCQSWGYGSLIMVNLFAYRATDPKDLKRSEDPIGDDNNRHIVMSAEASDLIIAAWGSHGKFLGRANHVIQMFNSGVLKCLKQNKMDKSPSHPLYLKAGLKPIPMVID